MRGRAVALGACAVALLLGAVPPAVAQDAPAQPGAEAPAPEPGAAPAAEPGAPPAAEPTTEPAAVPAAAGPPPTTAPVVEPPAPAAAANVAGSSAAPAPRAAAAAPAKGAAAPSAAHRPRKGVVRSRPRPAANTSQADVQVSEFEGRVTLADVQVLSCGSGACDSGLADYEVQDLQVRAESGGDVLIAVRRARVTGVGPGRQVTAQVTLRPPGERGRSGEVTLPPGADLLTQDVFAGTPLEEAYARVFAAPVFGPGGALERLTIVFGEGTVVKGSFGAVSISAADRLVAIRVPVRLSEGTFVRDGPLQVVGGTTDSSAPSPKRTATLRRANGDTAEPPKVQNGGGGGNDTAGPPSGDDSEESDDDDDEEDGGGLFGTIVSTCVLGVGACGEDDDEAEVRFVVDSRSVTITFDDQGRGTIEVGCPSGVEDVGGTALIESQIRIGERPRALSRSAEFTCGDGEIIRVDVQMLDAELDRLRDARGPMAARITVRVTGDDGLRAVDFDVVTLELAAG